jgi:hypothetical protein
MGYSMPWGWARAMDISDFRRLALSLDGAEERSHMGAADFRVGGRIFATLAAQSEGYGNLMLTPEVQSAFVEEEPDVFLAIPGGWGRMGATHVVLAKASEDLLAGALRTAWKVRKEKNEKTGTKRGASAGVKGIAKKTAVKSSAKRASKRSAKREAQVSKKGSQGVS